MALGPVSHLEKTGQAQGDGGDQDQPKGEHKATGTTGIWDPRLEDGRHPLRVSTACLRGCVLLEKASARS